MLPKGAIATAGVRTLDRVLVAIAVTLAVVLVATLIEPSLAFVVRAEGVDLVLDSVTTLVTAAVAVLAWVRYRERAEPVALVQAAAFLVLSIANGTALVLVVGDLDMRPPNTGFLTGQAPLFLASVASLLSASLLVVGLWAALRGATTGHPWATLAAPAVGLLGIIVLLRMFSPNLPPLSSAFAASGLDGPTASPLHLPVATPLGAAVHIVSAALFLWAALLSRRLYRRVGSVGDGYLAVGLLIAGFAQLDLAAYPGAYPGLVTGGDLLRVAFDIALLLGIDAEARATLGALRRSNAHLARLRNAEVDRAALEERTRLAREIHDGLAQDLWLAKLKVGRLEALPAIGPEAAALCEELNGAIDAGLAEARQAVIALRWSGEAQTSFRDLLARYVDDFADRFGVRAEFACDRDLPRVAPRAEAELLRIAQEALTNVRRHADATLIRVRADVTAGSLRLDIEDNGRGFDPASVGDGAFGLVSMRERAALIGGHLRIESRPHDGTTVSVGVPLTEAAQTVPSAS